MAKNFYVLDEDGNTLWHGRKKNDCPQAFAKFDDAEKRAKEYARSAPGKDIKVVGVFSTVRCDVSPPKSHKPTRR